MQAESLLFLPGDIHINLLICHYTRIQLSFGNCRGLVLGSLGDTKQGYSSPTYVDKTP